MIVFHIGVRVEFIFILIRFSRV